MTYHYSTDYERLYELLLAGIEPLCLVDISDFKSKMRVPVKITKYGELGIHMTNGISIVNVLKPELSALISECKRLNLEFLDMEIENYRTR